MSILSFSVPDLLNLLDGSTKEEKDGAEFGIIQMKPDGIVSYYNPYESARSGLSVDRVCNRHFFIDVAPCCNNFLVAQRFYDEDELDAIIDYVFTFRMRPTPVRLRLLKSASSTHQYLCVQRL